MPPGENLQVEIRVRPLNNREVAKGGKISWRFESNCMYEVIPSSGRRVNEFTFDRIHGVGATARNVYESCARQLVLETLNGFNATIFVYGQTSSGKTFTMSGNEDRPEGLMQLAAQDLWDAAQRSVDWDHTLRVSYLEIYNEKERDLLDPTNTKLSLIQGFEGVTCVGLTTVAVNSIDEVLDLQAKGNLNRETGCTGMNSTSSRSHAIFQLHLESRPKGCPGNERVRSSLLNLVDLAGSERHKDTSTEGQRKLEGSMINRSLLTLQKVIKALADCGGDRTKAPHIPLRESKLTRILDNSLGGDAKTLIICTVTPADLHRSETLSVLQFAKLAKMIKNKPQVNEKLSDKLLLQQYQKEIEVLKEQVAHLVKNNSKKRSSSVGVAKENISPQMNAPSPSPEDLAKWQAKLENMDNMVALYAKRFLALKEKTDRKRPRRMTWIDAESLFALRDRGVQVYDEENREWPSFPLRHEIQVCRKGGRISCPCRFTEAADQPSAHADGGSSSRANLRPQRPSRLGQRSRESLQRMVEDLEQELAYCKEAKARADEEVQKMLHQRLEWLDVLEKQKNTMREAIEAAFQATRRERTDFINTLKGTIW